jgi:hypothetical protein
MKDWKTIFENLSDSEKDGIALLRVMECTNGVIQFAYRGNEPWALSIEKTREVMNFSMGCIKRWTIPLKEGDVTFSPETIEILKEVRDLYQKGKKDDVAFAEFMKASSATAEVCGKERIIKASEILAENFDVFPDGTLNWGVNYLMQFL